MISYYLPLDYWYHKSAFVHIQGMAGFLMHLHALLEGDYSWDIGHAWADYFYGFYKLDELDQKLLKALVMLL